MTTSKTTQPVKPKAIALSVDWLVLQYLPRHRFQVVIACCNGKTEAMALKEQLCRSDTALTPCIMVMHRNELELVKDSGPTAIAS